MRNVLEQGRDFWRWFDKIQFSYHCVHPIHEDVFNPNVTIIHFSHIVPRVCTLVLFIFYCNESDNDTIIKYLLIKSNIKITEDNMQEIIIFCTCITNISYYKQLLTSISKLLKWLLLVTDCVIHNSHLHFELSNMWSSASGVEL